MTGAIDALRGGTYLVTTNRVRFVSARVVTDATANGTLEIGRRATRAQLQLRGPAVPPSQLILQTSRRTIRIVARSGSNTWTCR